MMILSNVCDTKIGTSGNEERYAQNSIFYLREKRPIGCFWESSINAKMKTMIYTYVHPAKHKDALCTSQRTFYFLASLFSP